MPQEPNEDLFESTKMTFGEHLEELRGALFRAILGLTAGTLVSMLFAHKVVEWIEVPLRGALDRFYTERSIHELESKQGKIPDELRQQIANDNLVFEDKFIERAELVRMLRGLDANSTESPQGHVPATQPDLKELVTVRMWSLQANRISAFSVSEVFMIWMKAGLVSGFILSSPWIFYQIWGFVAAGLYPHERRYVYTFLPISITLFLAGAALAYFFVFRYVLDFLFSFNLMVNIDPQPRISEWLSFVLLMPIGFGISFQLPLVMLVLERVGILSISAYIQNWRIAVLAIFVISMILTPAEPISMLIMAFPLTFLYFGGIGMCLWMPRNQNPYGEIADPS